jgi:hypothetical protein
MAVTVKKTALWRTEVDDRPGALAQVLAPLAAAGGNLRVVIGYAAQPGRAVVELFPVSGKRATAAAQGAGLQASPTPCIVVEGDDRPGLGARMAEAVAEQGVSLSFVVAQTVGRRFSAVFGCASDADADTAVRAIRAAAKPAPRPRSSAKRRR